MTSERVNIDELVGYAKANADAARTKDDQQTWAAHHRHALAAKAEIERLQKLVTEQGQEIAITRERDERLVAALLPFAAQAAGRDGLPPDWDITVPIKICRAARSAISADA